MRSTDLIVIVAVLAGCCLADEMFVRPNGCPGDIRLHVEDSYRELVNYTLDRCAAACVADGEYCRSISFYDNPENLTKVCSLNLGHSDELWTGLRYDQFWSYYERVWNIVIYYSVFLIHFQLGTTNCRYREFRHRQYFNLQT